ncbi:MAG: tetratricopeptide repeat protein [Candidatus Aminicenantes bacterium]|nr:tetratricopeptide repeat protein [Candidatus Aminicenantes bacterium]
MAALIGHGPSPAKRAALILLTVLLAFPLAAQENLGRGRITGNVLDENGRPVEGATVIAESQQSKARLEGTTDAKGRFVIAGLGTGSWLVVAKKTGYVESSVVMNVKQLVANPPATLALKKITGVASFLQDKAAGEFFDKGNQLFLTEKYDEALGVFNEFLVKFPEIYQAHLNIGACYLKKDDYDKAASEFQLVLDKTLQTQGAYAKDAQASLRALSGLGEIAMKKNDFDSARKYFTQALEISPQDEVAAYNVGEIFFSNQQPDEAVKFFEMAIRIKKDWATPYYRLGIVMLNKGDFARSLEYFNKCVQMDPEGPDAAQAKSMIATIEKIRK